MNIQLTHTPSAHAGSDFGTTRYNLGEKRVVFRRQATSDEALRFCLSLGSGPGWSEVQILSPRPIFPPAPISSVVAILSSALSANRNRTTFGSRNCLAL